MRRRTRIAAVGATSLAAALVTATLLSGSNGAGAPTELGAKSQAGSVLLAEASDHLPSETATDWVTYADHVVVVSAVSERRVPASRAEVERGEGVIGRQVTLKIDKVLWSRAGAPKAAPKTWDYNATGWQFTDGKVDAPRKMALHERPRVEPGHTYIMAMVWEEARCSPGDTPEPARWRGLGAGSEIPYDAGIIGNGEFEGGTQKVAKAQKAPAPVSPLGLDATAAVLEERLDGQAADVLAAELKSAKPGVKRQFAAAAGTTCG
ncbi:hypothetical protein [Streptomyces vilmorinianum]|uniref:hypothetical protein n=1 Tax=Streptomyces vilmorinianum TaxID=3051092 RepID=UPI0010FB50FC|nr:hypothetical protein [Streptomyces vilmorinianum]